MTTTTGMVIAIAASLIASLLAAPAAGADPIAQKRAEANAVWASLQQQNAHLEQVINQYDQAHQALLDTQGRIRDNKARLRVARHNLKLAERHLSATLVAAYKNGSPDPLATVLAARSVQQMLDEIDILQRANHYNAQVVDAVKAYKAEVVSRQHALERERARRASAEQQQAARAREVRGLIAAQKAQYASLNGQIRSLIAQRRAAEAAAARQRAARASAALAAARATQDQNSVASTSIGGVAGGGAAGGGSAPAPPPVQVTIPASSLGAQAAQIALGEQGVPYVWGGSSPGGFDCSGLVIWAFAQAGRPGLPHSSYALWGDGVQVPSDQLQPGDLVFFDGLGHVGIYVGGGSFVHAPHTGDVVKVSSLSDSWYSANYVGAVRIT